MGMQGSGQSDYEACLGKLSKQAWHLQRAWRTAFRLFSCGILRTAIPSRSSCPVSYMKGVPKEFMIPA